MPRQVVPGKNFRGWTPPSADVDPNDYVFPELHTYDITDEEWEEEPTNEIKLLKQRLMVLDSVLFGTLTTMFNGWFDERKWKNEKTAEAQRERMLGKMMEQVIIPINDPVAGEGKQSETAMRGALLWAFYAKRVLDTHPRGYYVSK